MKNIGIIAVLFLFFSCNSMSYVNCDSVNYIVLHETITKCNNQILREVPQKKNFNPLKLVLGRMCKKLNSSYLVVFSWVNHYPSVTNHFKCVIYDYKSSKVYYIINQEKNYKRISIKETDLDIQKSWFKDEKIILKTYFEDKIDSLNQNNFSSHIGSNYYIIDVKYQRCKIIKNL